MKYAVEFMPNARDAISFLIVGARDGEYLSECVVRIHESLQKDPYAVGEGFRDPSARRLVEGVLFILYYVDDFKRRVRIVAARRVRKPL